MTSVEALLILSDTLEERCMKNNYMLSMRKARFPNEKVLKRENIPVQLITPKSIYLTTPIQTRKSKIIYLTPISRR